MVTHNVSRGLGPDENTGKAARLAERIISAVRDIQYGSVEITVHDSKVVQIEKKEKIRFDKFGEPGLR